MLPHVWDIVFSPVRGWACTASDFRVRADSEAVTSVTLSLWITRSGPKWDSFAPRGWRDFGDGTHGLRRGLHSLAAPRLRQMCFKRSRYGIASVNGSTPVYKLHFPPADHSAYEAAKRRKNAAHRRKPWDLPESQYQPQRGERNQPET